MPHQCTGTLCSLSLRAPHTLDFSFDDVDLGWHFKASNDAVANLVVAKKTPLKRLESSASQASGSQAIASQANATLCQQAKEQLAIEDVMG